MDEGAPSRSSERRRRPGSRLDTADAYSGGRAKRGSATAACWRGCSRDDVVVATKVFHADGAGENDGGLSRKNILSEHRRVTWAAAGHWTTWDMYQMPRWLGLPAPIEETMQELQRKPWEGGQGPLHRGQLPCSPWQFRQGPARGMTGTDWTRFVSMQTHTHLIYREEEREMIPQCVDQGVAVDPGSPLAAACWPGSGPGTASGDPPVEPPTRSCNSLYCEADFDSWTGRGGRPRTARVPPAAGRAGLADAPYRGDRAHRRREGRSTLRRTGRRELELTRRRCGSIAEPRRTEPVLGHG